VECSHFRFIGELGCCGQRVTTKMSVPAIPAQVIVVGKCRRISASDGESSGRTGCGRQKVKGCQTTDHELGVAGVVRVLGMRG